MTKRRDAKAYYLTGLGLVGFGLGFILWQEQFSALLFALVGLVMIGQTLLTVKSNLTAKGLVALLQIVLNLLIGTLFLTAPILPTQFLAIIIAVYQLLLGVILLIHARLLFREQLSGRYSSLLIALVHLLVAGLILSYRHFFLSSLYTIIGWYLMFLGGNSWRDGLEFDFRKTVPTARRQRLGLPIFLTALIPAAALNQVNSYLTKGQSQSQYFGDLSQPVDLEIWIHTARRGFERMGHVDIAFEGQIYSYGNHDVDSTRLFEAVGDGVLMTLPVNQYKASLKADSWRAVFGYGLVLTADEKRAVQANLDKLLKQALPFSLKTAKQESSYLGRMMNTYGAKAYKFSSGKYKTYFVMTTNCVQLIDDIVGSTGLDILDSHGILTPGAYQAYLEREYQNPNSRVVSQMILGQQV